MLITQKKVKNYELISIVVNVDQNGGQYYFPDQPNLRDVHLETISAYTSENNTVSPDGIATYDAGSASQAYLVLNIGEREDIKIPVSTLLNVTGSSNNYNINGYLPFAGQKVHWSKSYVKFPGGLTVTTQFAMCFGIYYTK